LIAIAAAEPAPADVITWARGSATLPAAQTPDALVVPRPIDLGEAGLVELASQAGQQAIGMRHVPGSNEHRGSSDDLTVRHLDAGDPIVLDGQPRHRVVDDPDTAGLQAVALRRGEIVGVREEDHVVGPLPNQVGVIHRAGQRAQHPERLVAHLPPVAVGAMQQIAPPPLSNSGDVRQLVADARGHQHPPRVDRGT